jgi:uncharacterized membrane protein YbaN (DUF454 family)
LWLDIEMKRPLWVAAGAVSLGLGAIGTVLPLLPTVPFVILAAFCFARGSPAWEAKLLAHPIFGPHIRSWREKGAISRKGKLAATGAFAVSILIGIWAMSWPYVAIPPVVAAICLSWLWTRPEA